MCKCISLVYRSSKQLLECERLDSFEELPRSYSSLYTSCATLARAHVADTCSVFVNGRPRPMIMENMRSRIDRADIEAERQEAIRAMCDIALDRASKLQA